MLKKILYIITLSATLTACASSKTDKVDKNIVTRTVNLNKFTSIETQTGISVIYTQGELKPATIKAPAYVYAYINVQVSSGKLHINVDKEYFSHYQNFNEDVQVYVTAPNVNHLEASVGSSISVTDKLSLSSKCEFEASSGASINVNYIKAPTVDAEVSSGASISFTQLQAKTFDIESSSGASINASNISADITKAEASSGSGMQLSGATQRLTAEVSSGASINATKFFAKRAKIDASSAATINYSADDAIQRTDLTGSAKNHLKNARTQKFK